jgi:hypothetical protein
MYFYTADSGEASGIERRDAMKLPIMRINGIERMSVSDAFQQMLSA